MSKLLKELKQKITDLEAKLAKKDKSILFWKRMFDNSQEALAERIDRANEILKELAEKDRQIEQLKKFDDLNKTFFDLFKTAFKEPNKVDDLFNTLKTMQEKQEQDKISFAVERLEKVKEEIGNNISPIIFQDSYWLGKQTVLDKIDNQIKQLKSSTNGQN